MKNAIVILCIILVSNPAEDIARDIASEQISLLRVATFYPFPSNPSETYIFDLRASGKLYMTYVYLNTDYFLRHLIPDPGFNRKFMVVQDETGFIPVTNVNKIVNQTIIELTDEELHRFAELILTAYECEPMNMNLLMTFAPPDGVYMVINDKSYFFDYDSHGYKAGFRSYNADERITDLYKELCILSGFDGLRHQYNYN